MIESDANIPVAPPRHRATYALLGVVAAYGAFNAITSWIMPDNGGVVGGAIIGAWILEPLLFGIWAALGEGSILIRLPVIVPCLMLMFITPAIDPIYFADVSRIEFDATVLAGFAVFTVATILFLIFRWLTGFGIVSQEQASADERTGARFSLKYLLAITTLIAIVLGTLSQLEFQTEPSPANFFGPNFFISILIYGGSTLAATVLPMLSVPLFILHGRPSKRAYFIAFAFWATVTTLIVGFWAVYAPPLREIVEAVLLAQSGALLAGALTAILLRRAGLRLRRPPITSMP